MEIKQCIKCQEVKEISEFYIKHNKPTPDCKECIKTRTKEWRQKPEVKKRNNQLCKEYYIEHKEDINEQSKIYRDNNKETIKQQKHAYYEEHKQETWETNKIWAETHQKKIKQYKKEYRETHREELNAKQRVYEQEHKEELRIKRNERLKRRQKTDMAFKLRRLISNNITYYLKLNKSSKNGKSCLDYLPYTINELKEHIERLFSDPKNLDHNDGVWMTWENHGNYRKKIWDQNDSSTWKWQLDHRKPQSDYPYTSMEDSNFKLIWSLDNLRPYNAKQNWLDGINRSRHKKRQQMKKIIIKLPKLKKIYQKHIDGMSINDIAKQYKIKDYVLLDRFKENNFQIIHRGYPRPGARGIKLSKDIQNKITLLYSQDKSTYEISKIINTSVNSVCRVLHNFNIEMKTSFNYREKLRKYTISENYFHTISAQEKAYILGFLYADGNANKRFSQITLKLQEKDKFILETISKLIGTNKPLHFSKKTKKSHQNQYILKITNKVMYLDLIKYGITPAKTFITKFPHHLLNKLIPHFIRGYFDGDGRLSIDKKRKTITWGIIGSTSFILEIRKILQKKLNIKSYIHHDKRCKKGIDVLRIRKYSDIIKVCKWLYNHSTIHLDRKYKKIDQINKIKETI